MEATISTYDYLNQHNVKPSVQRMAVMNYLREHRTHPTADEIYTNLVGSIPTLSKTTVYNTLRLLVENGAAIMLTIDERNACFDAYVEPHAHFFCNECKKVYDLPLKSSLIGLTNDTEGFTVTESNLYYRGICSNCNKKNN